MLFCEDNVSNLPSIDFGGSSALREHQIIHPATAPSAGLFIIHRTRINPPQAPLYMSMGKQEVMLKNNRKKRSRSLADQNGGILQDGTRVNAGVDFFS